MASKAHLHREYSGSGLVDAAREALTGAGEQWTAMRADVFRELVGFDKPASAYDIADNLSVTRGKRVAPNSVYRILDIFVANNLAVRVESANAFLVNTHPGCAHDCIFLVCDVCGDAAHIDDDGISGTMRKVAQEQGFLVARPVIEIRGQCKNCQNVSGD
ncbi:MAG: Fur family transcriptional regulator [Sphingomonadaceae bacterium]